MKQSGVPIPARLHQRCSRRRPALALASVRPTHQHVGLCNPHDPRTRLAHLAPTRLRSLSAPPLTPVRVRNNNLRCCRQNGLIQRTTKLAVASFRSRCHRSNERDQRNSLVGNTINFPQRRLFSPILSTRKHACGIAFCFQGDAVAGVTGTTDVDTGMAAGAGDGMPDCPVVSGSASVAVGVSVSVAAGAGSAVTSIGE